MNKKQYSEKARWKGTEGKYMEKTRTITKEEKEAKPYCKNYFFFPVESGYL